MRKNSILFLALAFSGLINAQVFLGGGVGFSTINSNLTESLDNQSNPNTSEETINNFTFKPYIGYDINDNYSVGLNLIFTSEIFNYKNNATRPDQKNTTIGISPFIRYYFLNWNKLSVYGQAELNAYKSFENQTSPVSTIEKRSRSGLGVRIFPAVQYDLNNRFGLFMGLNFLDISYVYNRIINKNLIYNKEYVSNTHIFNFGIYSNNALKLSNLEIGLFFKI